MPNRIEQNFVLTEWEERLYRYILKYLRMPLESFDSQKAPAPAWLLPVLARVPEISYYRRVKLGLLYRCQFCQYFFSSKRTRDNHQTKC